MDLKDREIAERLKATIPAPLHPHMRFLLLLREPIARDLSQYNHMRAHNNVKMLCPETKADMKTGDYNQHLAKKLKCRQEERSCSKCLLAQTRRGNYASQLKWWFEHFAPHQFLVLNSMMMYDSDSRSAAPALRAVGEFLGLGGSKWEEMVAEGFPHSNDGAFSSKVEWVKYVFGEIDAEVCNDYLKLIAQDNTDLYRLLEEMRPKMSRLQPPFLPFPENPCEKAQGRPHPV